MYNFFVEVGMNAVRNIRDGQRFTIHFFLLCFGKPRLDEINRILGIIAES